MISPTAPWAYPQRQDRRAERRASLPLWLALRVWHSVQGALQPWLQWPQQRILQAQVLAIQGAVQQALEQPAQTAPGLAQHRLTPTQRQQQALVFVATTATQVLGRQPYPTQLHAAWLLLQGHLVEMATGEGKTYAAGLAAAAAALCGTPVHVMTANDYLVQRDADSLAPLFAALGLSLGCVLATSTPAQRRAAYACSVTYCTAREAAFDYLRDAHGGSALKSQLQHHTDALLLATQSGTPAAHTPVMRGLHLALVDEADSLLVDEAAMPLLLSAPLASTCTAAESAQAQQRSVAYQSLALARGLTAYVHYTAQADQAISLTPAGLAHIEKLAQPLGGAWLNRRHRQDLVSTALHALHRLQRDRDYLVQGADASTHPATPPRVQLLDAVTGRVAHGRSWQAQLQALVELKERCPPSPATQVVARLSLQRFFGRYLRLCGMSGTLAECAGSLRASYGPAVHRVPLRLPSKRVQLTTQMFASVDTRLQHAVLRVQALHAQGRPVLIGTDSVAAAQAFSAALQTAGVPHQRLDAKNSADHAFEAAVVAQAGQHGAVTVATHMAGRGTDITLGPGVASLGGLHVLCCQDNPSARLDRQFVGRAARAGDPGSAELWRCSTAATWRGTGAAAGSTPVVGLRLATAQGLQQAAAVWGSSTPPLGRNVDIAESTSLGAWAALRRAAQRLLTKNLVAAQNHHQRQHEHHRSLNRQQQLEQDLQWHTQSTP